MKIVQIAFEGWLSLWKYNIWESKATEDEDDTTWYVYVWISCC